MLKGLKNLVAFLTIIPVGMDQDCLADAAKCMSLFPLVGAFIGSLAGIFAWLLIQILPNLIVGILSLGFLLLITGLHHTDGLLDFGDGIMCQGTPEKKIAAMHDRQTGAGGFAIGLITLLTTALCISGLRASIVIQSLVVSEASAKLSMVFGAWVGKSAHKGMNTHFINAMHDRHGKERLIVAIGVSFGISTVLLWTIGSVMMISGIITGLILVGISNKHFGGMTGDVFGAMNELARMASLIAIMAMAKWA